MSSNKFRTLDLLPSLDVESAVSMLQTASSDEATRTSILDIGVALEMTEAQAERIFAMLHTFHSLSCLSVYLGHSAQALGNALPRLLQTNQPLPFIGLAWWRLDADGTGTQVAVPEASIQAICDGIGCSSSLRSLSVHYPPPAADVNAVATLLACAVAKSSSISTFYTAREDFAASFHRALVCTVPVQSFRLCFRVNRKQSGSTCITLNRNVPWQRLLPDAQDIELGFWFCIVKDTIDWDRETSHSAYGALFFLLTKKNDVLIPNARNR